MWNADERQAGCEFADRQQEESEGQKREHCDEGHVLSQSRDAKKDKLYKWRTEQQEEIHSRNRVTINQAIRKIPTPLWNSFSSANEAAIPLPGMRIVAYDIQNAP